MLRSPFDAACSVAQDMLRQAQPLLRMLRISGIVVQN